MSTDDTAEQAPKPREWWLYNDEILKEPVRYSGGASPFEGQIVEGQVHVIEKSAYDAATNLMSLYQFECEKLEVEKANALAELERVRAELSAWDNIAKLAERTRSEIYGMAYKLKPGKYGSPIPDIPTCSMSPESVKIHDDICDILEARAFNEDEVCTASVGIWAAIGVCEKQIDALTAENARLRQALKRECCCTGEKNYDGKLILCDACEFLEQQ